MTATRIVINGELRAHGRTVEIIVKPKWTHADLDTAESLQGAPVRITIESAAASEQAAHEPETPAPMPDRDALGRAVHAAWLDLRESNFGKRPSLAWDDLEDDLQELDRCVGERIFNMGALHGKQIETAEPAPAPTIEQIKERLRVALPNYRKLGFEPNAKNVITDISAEVAKMLEEARR